MINSKKLATTPLTELELGSVDFCISLVGHVDQGENVADIAVLLGAQPEKLHQMITKGRVVRDLFIRKNSEAMIKAVEEGMMTPPHIAGTKSRMKTFGEVAVTYGAGLRVGKFRADDTLYH